MTEAFVGIRTTHGHRWTLIVRSEHLQGQNSKETKNAIIEHAPGTLILAVCDCAQEVLKGKVSVGEEEFETLKSHRAPIRRIGERASVVSKRALLKKGGTTGKAFSALMRAVTKTPRRAAPRQPTKEEDTSREALEKLARSLSRPF